MRNSGAILPYRSSRRYRDNYDGDKTRSPSDRRLSSPLTGMARASLALSAGRLHGRFRVKSILQLVLLLATIALLVYHFIPDPVGDWIKRHPGERLPPTYREWKEWEKKMFALPRRGVRGRGAQIKVDGESRVRQHGEGEKYFFPARYVSGAFCPTIPLDTTSCRA